MSRDNNRQFNTSNRSLSALFGKYSLAAELAAVAEGCSTSLRRSLRRNAPAIGTISSLILVAGMGIAVLNYTLTGDKVREKIDTYNPAAVMEAGESITVVDTPIYEDTYRADSGRPQAFTGTTLDYPAVPMFVDGKIFGRAYEYKKQTYIDIMPFLAMLGIDAELEVSSESVKLTGYNFELTGEKGTGYIVVNGRYQYVPNGWLFADGTGGSSGSGSSGSAGGGNGSGAASSGSSNNLYLPQQTVDKIFGTETKEDDGALSIDTTEMKVIEGGENFYDITLDADTFYWLPHLVQSEAYNEPLAGRLAVANVVLNRVKHPLFPEKIYDVIYDTKYAVQFTPVAISGIHGTPDDLSYVAAFLAIEGYNNIDNCMYYVRPSMSRKNTEWFTSALNLYDTIGNHEFYYKPGDVIPD